MEFNFNRFCSNILFRVHIVFKLRKQSVFVIFDILFVFIYIYIELRIQCRCWEWRVPCLPWIPSPRERQASLHPGQRRKGRVALYIIVSEYNHTVTFNISKMKTWKVEKVIGEILNLCFQVPDTVHVYRYIEA